MVHLGSGFGLTRFGVGGERQRPSGGRIEKIVLSRSSRGQQICRAALRGRPIVSIPTFRAATECRAYKITPQRRSSFGLVPAASTVSLRQYAPEHVAPSIPQTVSLPSRDSQAWSDREIAHETGVPGP